MTLCLFTGHLEARENSVHSVNMIHFIVFAVAHLQLLPEAM